ncbi:Piso0_005321 [Millerozyma farinosa CBS 7064]|uniref:Piso0_005321 protein n=1 Tax=Pichia sorbitophila (strain ATCC MYA-4447 / BCRC 22081 / CBS 7064 / NBRC 10061 / NRRL Y-12695) TaxID=559304 RepID=G8Y1V5_PICSO|nr:Piso0_005321 [Millerozyma farinosa CBS 7064]
MENIVMEALAKRDKCEAGNEYDGKLWGARISSVFVVLVASAFGSLFPILSSRYSFIRMPWWCFFIAKYFGSGVIIATAFIHLLEPANDSLTKDCLGGTFDEYPWAYGIALMTLFVLFFCELVSYHYVDQKVTREFGEGETGNSHSHFGDENIYVKKDVDDQHDLSKDEEETDHKCGAESTQMAYPDHFSHANDHQDQELVGTPMGRDDREQYLGQLLNVFVLEFGIIFHSVFVGLTLATSGEEFKTLYVVIVFHQMFEGLGLGTRIAATAWPKNRRWTPWVLALAYTLTTPIAIGIGLGVRTSYPPGSRRALITNGCFDAISAGILIYTGLVELMAHEFLFSSEFKGPGGFKLMITAYLIVCVGAGLMALLGRWA